MLETIGMEGGIRLIGRIGPDDYRLQKFTAGLLTVGCSWPGHELLAQPRLPWLLVDHPA